MSEKSVGGKVGLFEDHVLIAESLRYRIVDWGYDELVHMKTEKELFNALRGGEDFKLLIMDIGIPDTDIERTFAIVRRDFPDLDVLFLSGSKHTSLTIRLLRMGAKGYVSKVAGFDELNLAIKVIQSGEVYIDSRVVKNQFLHSGDPFETLSVRELAVCEMLILDKSYREIADVLFIETNTVGTYWTRINQKLKVGSREELKTLALRYGRFS